MSKADLLLISGALDNKYGTYHPVLAHELGLNAAVILDKLVYWNGNDMNNNDGYFFKTTKQLYIETGLKTDAQTRALTKLKLVGLIFADKYDYRHRRMMKANMPRIINYCNELRKNIELDGRFPADQFAGNHATFKKNQQDLIQKRANSPYQENEHGELEIKLATDDIDVEVLAPWYKHSFTANDEEDGPIIS